GAQEVVARVLVAREAPGFARERAVQRERRVLHEVLGRGRRPGEMLRERACHGTVARQESVPGERHRRPSLLALNARSPGGDGFTGRPQCGSGVCTSGRCFTRTLVIEKQFVVVSIAAVISISFGITSVSRIRPSAIITKR